jgi:hypothetical protein
MRGARWVLVSLVVAVLASEARAADPPAGAPPAGAAGAPGIAQPAGGAPPAGAAPPGGIVPAAAVTPPADAPPPPPPPAPAATTRTEPPKKFAPLKTGKLTHDLQFGIAVLPGTGYRGIFPYQEMIDCGQPGKRVCTGRLPFFLDVQPSFGFGVHWDVLVDLRFGLGQDFTNSHEFAVAPGVRYWVDPDENAKFFATVQMAYDTTAQHNTKLTNNDFALRNSNGFMYEVMRNFGVYVQFGETIGFVRWLRFEIDGGIGVQARLP